jgi:hypothetical protein
MPHLNMPVQNAKHACDLAALAAAYAFKQANLAGFTPGATTRTGLGQRQTPAERLIEVMNARKPAGVAVKSAPPVPSPSGVGLSSAAYLSPESAQAMGALAERAAAIQAMSRRQPVKK